MHHIALHTSYDVNTIPVVSLVINECGYPCTAMFFLFSGYGCWLSLNKIQNTNNRNRIVCNWGFKHIFQLYVIFIFVMIITIPLISILQPGSVNLKEVLLAMPLMQFPFQRHWFPIIQVLCYCVISFSFLITKKHNDIIVVTMIIIYMIIARISGLPTFWYNSVIAFPIGVLFAKYSTKIKLSKRANVILCAISGFAFSVMLVAQAYMYSRSYLVSDSLRVLSSVILCVFVILLSSLYTIDSKILKYIGNASFECFLLHWVSIKALEQFNINSEIAIIIIFVSTIVVSIFVHKLVTQLFKGKTNIKKV